VRAPFWANTKRHFTSQSGLKTHERNEGISLNRHPISRDGVSIQLDGPKVVRLQQYLNPSGIDILGSRITERRGNE